MRRTGSSRWISRRASGISWRGEDILFLLPYKTESLLIGVASKGMFRYDKRTQAPTAIHKQQKLSAKSYTCFVDSHDNIWLSDQKPPFQFYPDKARYETILASQDQLADPSIKQLCLDRERYLWIRSSHDMACYDLARDKLVYHAPGHAHYGCLFIDSRNRLWAITNYRQLNEYTLSKGRPRLIRTFPFPDNLFSIGEDTTGRIWVALADKLAVIDTDGNITYQYAVGGALHGLSLRADVPAHGLERGLYLRGRPAVHSVGYPGGQPESRPRGPR